jgi:soluble lytic murein transglycosylase
MQLMPQTARETARSAGVRLDKPSALLDPGTNIALGTTYMRQMLARYNGNFAMAAAAYNAGPGRVRQWQGSQCVPSERWIESIPFTETRGYVRRALFYAAIYQRRLERPIMKLTTIMPPIPARDARVTEPCPS